MKVFISANQLCVSDGDKLIAKNIKAYFRYRNDFGRFIRLESHGNWVLTEKETYTEAVCDNTVIRFIPYKNGLMMKTVLTNDGADIDAVDEFMPISFQTDSAIVKALGSTIKKSNGNRTNEMGTEFKTCNPVYGESLDFSDFTAYSTANGNNTVLGYSTAYNYFGNLEIWGDGMAILKQFYESHPIASGEKAESDRFFILPCDDLSEGIVEFTDTVADFIQTERNTTVSAPFEIPCGYCTWYYYLKNIYGKTITDSLEVIEKNSDRLPLKYYQIDDGWYKCYGEWDANEKFPMGMKYYADRIKEAGLIPGLWISPLRVDANTDMAKNHPEYFVRDRNPKNETDTRHLCDNEYYLLDFSVPEVCDYMTDLIKRITVEWGYQYIKIDHIASSIGPFVHSDPDFNACRNYIKCIEVIRAAAPEGTFILDCTAPFLGGVGIVDGMRISGDIQGDWLELQEVFGKRVLKRWYYHNTFFTNDADCLIIRKPENEDEECRHHCMRNDTEIKSYITAMAASGGALMLSDKLELLSEEQIKLITYLFPQNLKPAVPLDLTEANLAGVLDFGQRGKIRIVALINWYDGPHTLSVNVGKKHVFEFWSNEHKGICNGIYSEEIEPHGCRVLFITDTNEPAVIGSDSCLVPDIQQSYNDGILDFTFEKKDESLFIAADNISGEGCLINKVKSGLFKVTQQGDVYNISVRT